MSVIETTAGTDRFIAGVLRQAHVTAEMAEAPDEARAVLHVAELFADALAETDEQFDRVRFIDAATLGDPNPRPEGMS